MAIHKRLIPHPKVVQEVNGRLMTATFLVANFKQSGFCVDFDNKKMDSKNET